MRRWLAYAALLGIALPAVAGQFRTIAENGTVMYDAPSLKAKKLFVTGSNYPVEVVTDLDNWVKVRDSTGALAWVEKKALSDSQMVVVTAPVADVRSAAGDQAPLVFQAQQGVVLAVAAPAAGGWVKVRRSSGEVGYVKASQVWGI